MTAINKRQINDGRLKTAERRRQLTNGREQLRAGETDGEGIFMKTSLWRLESTNRTDRIISISITVISLFVLAVLSWFVYLGVQMHSYNTGLGFLDFFGAYMTIYAIITIAIVLFFLNVRFLDKVGRGYSTAILFLTSILFVAGLYVFYLILNSSLLETADIPLNYFIWLSVPLCVLSIILFLSIKQKCKSYFLSHD